MLPEQSRPLAAGQAERRTSSNVAPDCPSCCCTVFRSTTRCGPARSHALGRALARHRSRPAGLWRQPGHRAAPSRWNKWPTTSTRCLDALGVDEPIVLCGLSMGGYVAFQFWRKYAWQGTGARPLRHACVARYPGRAAGRLKTGRARAAGGNGLVADAMLPKLFEPATFETRPDVLSRSGESSWPRRQGSRRGTARHGRAARRRDRTDRRSVPSWSSSARRRDLDR